MVIKGAIRAAAEAADTASEAMRAYNFLVFQTSRYATVETVVDDCLKMLLGLEGAWCSSARGTSLRLAPLLIAY